jgi:hypothetical protein
MMMGYFGNTAFIYGKLKERIEVEMEKVIDNHSPHIEGGLVQGDLNNTRKSCKIFISHASKDKDYVVKLVELLEDIGVGEGGMFCSSVNGYGIPMDENIYDYLREQFREYNLHVIYVLSDNYYRSVACLNEMGAAWVLMQKYSSILLPKFKYENINGAVDPRRIALKLDDEEGTLNQRLGEFMDGIVEEFELQTPSRSKWDRIRNKFKSEIKEIADKKATESKEHNNSENDERKIGVHTISLSSDAVVFLAYAGDDERGEVLVTHSLGGTSISVGKWDFAGGGGAREEARWMSVIEELEKYGLLKAVSYKREVFNLTYNGFRYSDKAREQIDTDRSPNEYLEDEEI